MSKADKLFVNMCEKILTEGFSTEGETVRARWEDGSPAYTIKTFGVVNRYDLSEEFPALTLRPTAIKSATDEILWIWQRKSNNIHDLKPHIWDEWADEDGSIGKAYGYQMAILKSNNGDPSQCNRYTFSYDNCVAGEGHFIHTYMHDGNPLPSFEGEPKLVEIPDDIDAFTELLWSSLNEDNKVSLFTRYIDIATGKYETRIVNKNK